MSYTVRKTISVPYEDHETHVSGPDSARVTVTTTTITRYKDVDINVNVDTDPFDDSVDTCAGRLDGLTGAIVGFKVANVASKKANEKAITDKVTNGFLTMIEQNINLQNVGMEAEMTALAGELMLQCKELAHKHDVMTRDYNRIKSRYADLFTTLNKELSNRIHALIKPCFDFVDNVKEEQNRSVESSLLSMATVGGKENDEARIAIQSTKIKHNATTLIAAARDYVNKNHSANRAKELYSVVAGEDDETYYAPVILTTKHDTRPDDVQEIHLSPLLNNSQQMRDSVVRLTAHAGERELPPEERERISAYFDGRLHALDDGTERGRRIVATMKALFEQNKIYSFAN